MAFDFGSMVRAVRSKLGKSVACLGAASGAGVPQRSAKDGRGARHELVEMADHRVRNKLAQRFPRIAEAHRDRGHPGSFCRGDVDVAVAHHDGLGRVAAGLRDHLGEVPRVWLRYGEGVAAGDAF